MSDGLDREGGARQMLCAHLRARLEVVPAVLRADIMEALAVEGKLFHRPATRLDGRWALAPLCLARALCAEADLAPCLAVALAVECLICATDLCDDVMDEDVTPLIERLGQARALNVALALLSLSHQFLLSSQAGPLLLLEHMQRAFLLAVIGQQRDILAEKRPACELSREDCVQMAAAKAGSLLGLACRLAALCAGSEEALVERCTELGCLLGIAAQLDNDAHDLARLLQLAPAGRPKSDLRRGKKTLPVVLAARALRAGRQMEAGAIDRALQHLHTLAAEERQIYVAALREGILTTWGLSLLYRERARACFDEIMGAGPAQAEVLQVLGLVRTETRDWEMGYMGGGYVSCT